MIYYEWPMIDNNLTKKVYASVETPYFVFYPEIYQNNLDKFMNAFRSRYSNLMLGYSFKTNNLPELIQLAKENGLLAEVVSKEEYDLALSYGFHETEIIFNGPGKKENDIREALIGGSQVNLDSIEEVNIAINLAKENSSLNFKVGLRINYYPEKNTRSRFGIFVDTEDLKDALLKINDVDNLVINGLHIHTSYDRSLISYKCRLDLIFGIIRDYNEFLALEYINLGGGFYGEMPNELKLQFNANVPTFDDYAELICSEMKKFFQDESVKLIFEPGIALVGNTMHYVCEVLSVKMGFGKGVANTNGSIQVVKPTMHNLNMPISLIPKDLKKSVTGIFDIGGYTCLEHDIMYKGYDGQIGVGDLLIFENVGAYTTVLKPSFIRGMPKIIQIGRNEWNIIHENRPI